MILQHNIASMNVQRQLNIVGLNKQRSTEKLASGYRINKAADDAAGLAVSEKLRAQVRGLTRASENVEDGISYVRTADGALSEVGNMLQRMRELAVQASNTAVNAVDDRAKIQSEISEIRKEINRVFTDTEFNRKKIWDPSRTNAETIQVGTETHYATTIDSTSVTNTITNTNRYAFSENGQYKINADASGMKVTWKGYNGTNYESALISWKNGDPHNSTNFELKDYLDTGTHPELVGINAKFGYSADALATTEDVISGINNTTISSWESSTERIQLYGEGGGTPSGVSASVSINYKYELTSNRDFEKADTSFIEGSQTNRWDMNAGSDKLGFTFEMEGVGTVETRLTGISYSSPDRSAAAENVWWRWSTYMDHGVPKKTQAGNSYTPSPADGSVDCFNYIVNNNDGINLLTDHKDAAGNPIKGSGSVNMSFSLMAGGKSVGTMTLNASVLNSDTGESLLNRIKSIKGADIFASADPNNNSDSGAASVSTSTSYVSGGKRVAFDVPIMESAGVISEYIQAGANEQQGIYLNYRYLSGTMLGIRTTNVEELEGAQEALSQVDKALGIVSEERARFGSYENRLDYAKKIDDNTAENLQAAESRLRDTDMAKEMSRLAKENILEQAGVSILAQANQSTRSVLSLLGGQA